MSKLPLLCSLLIVLSSCATSKKIIGPDGTENVLIESASLEAAYEEARTICQGPYKIINSNSASVKYGVEYSLLVKCGG